MKDFLLFLKNLLQLVLSSRRAWRAVAEEAAQPSTLMSAGFYPLTGLVAATAVLHGLYDIATFNIGVLLVHALVQTVTLLVSLFVTRGILEFAMPHLTINPPTAKTYVAANTVCIYCISLLAVIQIIANCCPVELSILWFLPAFVAVIACQSSEYLTVSPYRNGLFIILAIVVLVVIPILLGVLLNAIVG